MLQIPTPKSKKGKFGELISKEFQKKTGLLERFVKVYLMVFCVLYTHFFSHFLEHCAIVDHNILKQNIPLFHLVMLKIICLSILDDITKKTKNLELVKGRCTVVFKSIRNHISIHLLLVH